MRRLVAAEQQKARGSEAPPALEGPSAELVAKTVESETLYGEKEVLEERLTKLMGGPEGTGAVNELINLVASVRVDRHPLLDSPVFSPRGAAIFRVTPRQSLRASVGSAFRTPLLNT